MKKELILVRGLPGSGKSTFAKLLGGKHLETDMFFLNKESGKYEFDVSRLKEAHAWCQNTTERYMQIGEQKIVVSNTFTQEWEMKVYLSLAERYGYTVHTIIKENRHGGETIHNVPKETINKMANRFAIKII